MSKISLKKRRALNDYELTRYSNHTLELRNSKQSYAQVLGMEAIMMVLILVSMQDNLNKIDEFWNSLTLVYKLVIGLVLLSFGAVA